MRKIIVTLFSVTAFVCGSYAAAPQLPKKCEAFRPKKLASIVLTESEAEALVESADFGQGDAPQKGQFKYWDVYSDRDNNTTYEAPGSTVKFSSLRFNEQVRIARIQNGYALVYTDPKIVTYPLISEAAECKGWVSMKKLLLWQNCLANERGIYNKALLCVNLNTSNAQTKSFGQGFLDPSKRGKALELSTDMNFYFIMKREKDMALLAIQNRMDGSVSDQVLFCWVPEQSFVPWNQRSCLEPTWEHADVEYFAANKIQVDIFKDVRLSGNAISRIPFKKKTVAKYEQYLYRMNPISLRFPILDNGSDAIYNLSTFSTIGGTAAGTEETPVDEAEKAKMERLEKMQNINLAIVIDGTSSMEPYYPAVKEAIKEGCQYFSKNYKIKIGVVIFRDYSDGEQGLTEVLPMTDVRNLTRVNEFLDSGGKYGIRSSPQDLTQTEALFYGLGTALDKLKFKDGESNIMLVVGDCGNAADDMKCPTADALIAKVVEKNVHLMGFQVQNKNIVAYNSFNNQVLSLMRKSLQQKYVKLNSAIKVVAGQSKSASGALEGYNFRGNVKGEQLYICNHRFADANVGGGRMDPVKLTTQMTSAISDFAKTIKYQIDLIFQKGNAAAIAQKTTPVPTGIAGGQGDIDVDLAFVENVLGKDWVEAMKGSNALVNFRGFAKKQDASGREFFKPVIFISAEEFQDLLKRLAPVAEAASNSQTKDRTPYIEALKALVRSLAPGMTDAEMSRLSNGDIMNMIAGLNESASALQGNTLDDLSNQQAVNPAQYLRIITDFRRKYANLVRIRQSKGYKFIKEFNGATYYWVPIEDLP